MVAYVKLYKRVNGYYMKENLMTAEKHRSHLFFPLMFFYVLQVFRVLPSGLETHFSILQTVMDSKIMFFVTDTFIILCTIQI
jgi:hypothetical protein